MPWGQIKHRSLLDLIEQGRAQYERFLAFESVFCSVCLSVCLKETRQRVLRLYQERLRKARQLDAAVDGESCCYGHARSAVAMSISVTQRCLARPSADFTNATFEWCFFSYLIQS